MCVLYRFCENVDNDVAETNDLHFADKQNSDSVRLHYARNTLSKTHVTHIPTFTTTLSQRQQQKTADSSFFWSIWPYRNHSEKISFRCCTNRPARTLEGVRINASFVDLITVYNVRFNRLINKCATMAVWLILAVLGTIPDELAQYWYTACTVAQQKRLPFWKLQLATRSVLLSQNCRAAMRTPCALCSPITTCTANLYREWWPSCFISVQQKWNI